MRLPGFSGEASAYQTTTLYRACTSVSQGPPLDGLVLPAYRPGLATQSQCSDCIDGCNATNAYCNAEAGALATLCFFFPPACAAAGGVQLWCDAEHAFCRGYCEVAYCCPKLCGFPDPLRPGVGCCDSGEHCVDENDPNARSGCCPSDRAVCGGKCCNVGEVCVGDFCCPADATTVCNGVCCAGACTPSGDCCLSPGHVCGNNCCAPFSTCCNGECCAGQCCNGRCCGPNQDCHPTLGICCSTVCGPSCCPEGHVCTDARTGTCSACPPGLVSCKSTTEQGIPVDTCCPPGVGCCYGKCCDAPGKWCCFGGCYEFDKCLRWWVR
jgi:hypothetical protein